jgi:hypothetical protein
MQTQHYCELRDAVQIVERAESEMRKEIPVRPEWYTLLRIARYLDAQATEEWRANC